MVKLNTLRARTSRRGKPVKKKVLKNGSRIGRSNADQVLGQGTGRTVVRAFGSDRVQSGIPRQIGLSSKSWDAFDSCHAALPRAVGPYTVVRTTSLINTSSRFSMIGTTQISASSTDGGPYWSNYVMATEEGPGAIKSTASTTFWPINAPGGTAGANVASADNSTFTCCPAAISVQIMGQRSLQEASGQMAAAVVPARMDLFSDTRTWNEVEGEVISYFRPRLMSAGKLVLRGVQMNSMPLSMAEVSEFLPMFRAVTNTAPKVWEDRFDPHFRGWAPMVLFNPSNEPLSFLVTIEWRVRFDINNPAVSSHVHHGVTQDSSWDTQLRRAHAALPGVIDIVEKVANTGLSLYGAAKTAALL